MCVHHRPELVWDCCLKHVPIPRRVRKSIMKHRIANGCLMNAFPSNLNFWLLENLTVLPPYRLINLHVANKINWLILVVHLPDWDSLWSSSIWWRSSCSNPLFNQCRELIWFSLRLQNLLGSRMFSTEKANFRHEFLSVFGVVGGIVRVKSTGHTCWNIYLKAWNRLLIASNQNPSD